MSVERPSKTDEQLEALLFKETQGSGSRVLENSGSDTIMGDGGGGSEYTERRLLRSDSTSAGSESKDVETGEETEEDGTILEERDELQEVEDLAAR